MGRHGDDGILPSVNVLLLGLSLVLRWPADLSDFHRRRRSIPLENLGAYQAGRLLS